MWRGPSSINTLTRKRCVDGNDGEKNWDRDDLDDADGSVLDDAWYRFLYFLFVYHFIDRKYKCNFGRKHNTWVVNGSSLSKTIVHSSMERFHKLFSDWCLMKCAASPSQFRENRSFKQLATFFQGSNRLLKFSVCPTLPHLISYQKCMKTICQLATYGILCWGINNFTLPPHPHYNLIV